MAAGVVKTPIVIQDVNTDLGALITFVGSNNETDNTGHINTGNAKGIKVVVDITAVTTTTCTVTIEGIDQASGKHYTILASAALSTVSTTVLSVYPGLTASANTAANDHLPAHINIKAVLSNGTTLTATIGACLLF